MMIEIGKIVGKMEKMKLVNSFIKIQKTMRKVNRLEKRCLRVWMGSRMRFFIGERINNTRLNFNHSAIAFLYF